MSQTMPIANRKKGAVLKRADDVIFRRDGEDDQIMVLSKEDMALPLILNHTAARIFSLCDGTSSVEDIAKVLCDEFELDDFDTALEDVKFQIEYFLDKKIVKILKRR